MNSTFVFYIGIRALPNLLLALPNSTFKVYDPLLINDDNDSDSVSTQTSTINKLIRKRNFYIEKVKDATSIGILVGTLVVQNYLDVIERLKTILRKVHKKFYVVSIGEINPCKLGNFMDIDCFIFVGCPEVVNYYISDESKGQFFQPIVTPYDVELAFCFVESDSSKSTEQQQQYIIDWAFLIEKGPPQVKDVEDDVSLITGGLRTTIIPDSDDKTSTNQVVNWLGLDVNEESPSTNFSQIHQGRSGIASSYADEPVVK
jgi:diphthamide biosynthesis protein 2